ncbi:MAG TPA: FecR family protein [Methylocella sp.]|nr:FecR family protein [Methylocella sp.]
MPHPKKEDGPASIPDSARDGAIDWWMRQSNGPLSKEEQAEFAAWLASDEVNRAAFQKISRITGVIAARRPGAKTGRKQRRSLKIAAGVLAGGVALYAGFDDLSVLLRSDYSTGTGQTKTVTLADGSHVELDARSAIAVHYDAGQRRISLLQGEAWFGVLADPARPFVVDAAGGTVTALGTAFDVEVEKAWAQVMVTSHRVAVESGGGKVIIEEGQQSSYAEGTPPPPPEPANIEHATAWRRGKLIFRNKPLGEVVAALGRYHHGYVYLTNAGLRTRPVSGVFSTDDPLAVLDQIETALGVHALYLSNYLIILYE